MMVFRRRGADKQIVGVKHWIARTKSPSGMDAQPPVTPPQTQQEIIQFHPHACRMPLR